MARHPRDEWDTAEQPQEAAEQPKAAAPPADLLAQLAAPIYATTMVTGGTMPAAIETAQELWLAAQAAPTAPPVNRDVPYVEQNGTMLACTMGNWENEPTGYAYQWHMDGEAVGQDASWHQVTGPDVGRTATCVVTARNGLGATAAPPSNEVVVAAATGE